MNQRIKNLDPLRAILAILVMFHHIPQVAKSVSLPIFDSMPIFHKGQEAVMVFFVLSGYLIVGLLYDEKEKFQSISIKDFYIRRVLRLYPVYYLVMIIGFVLYHWMMPRLGVPFEINYELWQGILLNVAFLPNIFEVLFDPGTILVVLWSIGIEEQFYLMIAPLLRVFSIKNFLKTLLVILVVYFFLFHSNYIPQLSQFNFFYQYLLAGGVAALLERSGVKLYISTHWIRIVLYIVFILFFTTKLFHIELKVLDELFELILFPMVIVNIGKDTLFNIRSKVFNYLGRISYGIYMYHMIVVYLVLFVFMKITSVFQVSSLILNICIYSISFLGSFWVSHLSFKYYEGFFLNLKKKYRKV